MPGSLGQPMKKRFIVPQQQFRSLWSLLCELDGVQITPGDIPV